MNSEFLINFFTKYATGISNFLTKYETEISLSLRFFSLIISLLTFWVAKKAYGKYLSDKGSEKQLEVVIDLVKKIESLKFKTSVIRTVNNKTMSTQFTSELNIFSTAFYLYKKGGKMDIVYSYEVVRDIFVKIYELHQGFLIPRSIAKTLMEFDHFGNYLTIGSRTIDELKKFDLIQEPFLYISNVGQDELSEKVIFIESIKDVDKPLKSALPLIKKAPSSYKYGYGLSNIITFCKKLDNISNPISH